MNNLQSWVAGGVILVAALIIVAKLLTMANDAWRSGDWFNATQKTVGPLISFAFYVSVGTIIVTWGLNTTYNRIKASEVVQGAVAWGSSGVGALAGTFSAPEIAIPETQPLTEALQGAASELTGAASPSAASAPDRELLSAPANNVQSSVAPAWGIVREVAPVAPTRNFIGPVAPTPATAAPVQGPQPAPAFGPQPKPTFVDPASLFGGGGPQTYTVQRGDSLFKIAKHFGLNGYGSICEANRSIVGRNCNIIRSGMVLAIP
jgi:nucleoid-associated protein YgaU